MADTNAVFVLIHADCAANLNVLRAEAAQVADVLAVVAEAYDEEMAVVVGDFGWADVEEAGAICEFDDIVDVGLDADVVTGRLGFAGGLGFTGRLGLLWILRERVCEWDASRAKVLLWAGGQER